MLHFQSLRISEWQQFRALDVEFHNRLTVLTGANASGKTTLLNLLGRHVGWDVPSLAVPYRSKGASVIRFLSRWFGAETGDPQIGTLTYDNGSIAKLVVPGDTTAPSYQVRLDGQQKVRCFFLPSHRAVYRYQQVTQIPVTKITKDQAFQKVWTSTRGRFFGGNDNPPSYHMKEVLISWSLFGRGNQDMEPDSELMSSYEGFQATLRRVLPKDLGFKRLSIRNMELIVECDAGDFLIDAASGGLSAIIDLAWQVFMFSTGDDDAFTVMIDEVENHLHPVMQKRVLGDFLAAFPTVRFIVSTHSPLIVNSVKESAVYALRFGDDGKVTSAKLDLVRKARTATQILDEVLGVSSTLPGWAEEELQRITARYAKGALNETHFQALRQEVNAIGLGDYMPQALGKLLDAREK